jgi:peroxiredoxin
MRASKQLFNGSRQLHRNRIAAAPHSQERASRSSRGCAVRPKDREGNLKFLKCPPSKFLEEGKDMMAPVDKTLEVGDSAPDFILPDTDGNAVRLYSLLREGHVVIVFYRGNWCPYCDLQLRDFQRRLADLRDLRAQVVAISPQPPANLLWTQIKNRLEFPVLSDLGDKVARQFGLLLQVSDRLRELYYDLFRHQLEDATGPNGKEQLPVPGTFFVHSNGTIRLAHVDVDHTRRLKADEIIETLTEPTPHRVRQTQPVF